MTDLSCAPWALDLARRLRTARWIILIVWAVVIVEGLKIMDEVVHDPDVLVYFDDSGIERQNFEAVATRFGRTNEVVTLVVPDAGPVYTPDALRALARLTLAAAIRPEVTAVRSILTAGPQSAQSIAAMDDAALSAYGARLEAAVAAARADYAPWWRPMPALRWWRRSW